MLKTKTKVIVGLAGFISVISAFSSFLLFLPRTSATTCTSSPCNTTFNVDVKETLSVSVTTPTEWASGDVNQFLRNKITVEVVSNNPNGFVVGMNSGNASSVLTNTAKSTVTLGTLASGTTWTRSSNVTNFWGYSTDDAQSTGTYYPVVNSSSTPTKLFDSDEGTSKDVYFGAKADITQASGTYAGTVVITAISGTKTISTPSNPATPDSQEEVAHYDSTNGGGTNGTTTYTYTTTNTTDHTTTTTTQVSDGDNRDAYANYTPPQGATETTESNIAGNSPLAASLAVTAAVAAAAGVGFYILAKRRERDEEEEEI